MPQKACSLIKFENILKAAEACGDTSVLEALFPGAFETEEGKALLEKKKAIVKENTRVLTPEKEEKITLILDKKKASLLRQLCLQVEGSTKKSKDSPDRFVQEIYDYLNSKGVELVPEYFQIKGNRLVLPDTWEEFYGESK